VCLFQICMFQFHLFCFVSRFFSRCKHPRTSCEEMRRCLKKVYIYVCRYYYSLQISRIIIKESVVKKGQLILEFHSLSLKYLTCQDQVKDAGFLGKQHSLKRGFSFKHALFLETGIFLK
jgi:hypothetical protein